MASNFDFLKEQFPQLFTHAIHTESLGIAAPVPVASTLASP